MSLAGKIARSASVVVGRWHDDQLGVASVEVDSLGADEDQCVHVWTERSKGVEQDRAGEDVFRWRDGAHRIHPSSLVASASMSDAPSSGARPGPVSRSTTT